MRVFAIAGEPSGDALGGAILTAMRAEMAAPPELAGVGGPRMEAAGLQSLFPMSDLSVMGLVEVVPRLPALLVRKRQVLRAIRAFRPDILLTIDSPEFALRVARSARRMLPGLRIVHCVAPSVWAWRPERAARLRGVVDHLLCLLPFEPDYFMPHGIATEFIGHPLVAEPQASAAQASAFRLAHGLGEAPMALILPGSRRSEVTRIGPVLGQALDIMTDRRPDLRAVLPAAPAVVGQVTAEVSQWPVKPLILDHRELGAARHLAEKRASFAAADLALTASGSVTLELAAADTPMVVAHDLHPVSRAILRRMLRTDVVSLPNLVTGTGSVPEFLGRACQPGPVAEAGLALLDRPGAQRAALAACVDHLRGNDGMDPATRAARAILSPPPSA